MNQDRFFATYDGTTLLVSGRILTVTPRGHDTIITLRTGLPTNVLCDVARDRVSLHAGAAAVVETIDPQYDVSSESEGIMITNCRIHSG